MIINMFEAKTNLSKLVHKSLEGEEVLIANRGKALVKLVPVKGQKGLANFSGKKGKWTDYDDAFSEETETHIGKLFGGSEYEMVFHEDSPPYNQK